MPSFVIFLTGFALVFFSPLNALFWLFVNAPQVEFFLWRYYSLLDFNLSGPSAFYLYVGISILFVSIPTFFLFRRRKWLYGSILILEFLCISAFSALMFLLLEAAAADA